jgi:hypothetical protein
MFNRSSISSDQAVKQFFIILLDHCPFQYQIELEPFCFFFVDILRILTFGFQDARVCGVPGCLMQNLVLCAQFLVVVLCAFRFVLCVIFFSAFYFVVSLISSFAAEIWLQRSTRGS